jgi:hypothetical protein
LRTRVEKNFRNRFTPTKTANIQELDRIPNPNFYRPPKIQFHRMALKINPEIPADFEVSISSRNRNHSQIASSERPIAQFFKAGWN